MPVVRYGKASLLDLFDGRHQLIICHFMLDPDVSEGCPDCSHLVDNIPIWRIYTRHLARARVPRTARQDRALPGADGLDRPVVFPVRERLQFDFHVTTDEAVARVEHNYQDKATLERKGETYHLNGEQPGLSVFLCVGRQYFSHLLDLWARARGVAGHVPVPRPDAARPTGGLREFTRRMAADLEQWRILGPPPGQVDKRPGNSDAGCHSAEDRVTMRSPSGNVASQP